MRLPYINWDQVVEDLGPSLFNYFQSRTSASAADDLTQECLLRLYKKQADWDPNKGSLKMYAYGIARFVLYEFSREKQNDYEELNETEVSLQHVEEEIQKKQLSLKVKAEIQKLSPIQQECLSLMMDESLSLDQISKIVSIPVNTVKSHVHRAKEQLRLSLKSVMEII